MLTADELLAGSALTFEVEVPAALLTAGVATTGRTVRLRPLTVHDLQRILDGDIGRIVEALQEAVDEENFGEG